MTEMTTKLTIEIDPEVSALLTQLSQSLDALKNAILHIHNASPDSATAWQRRTHTLRAARGAFGMDNTEEDATA
jgi:chemotaxis protein histidine kinase CheA